MAIGRKGWIPSGKSLPRPRPGASFLAAATATPLQNEDRCLTHISMVVWQLWLLLLLLLLLLFHGSIITLWYTCTHEDQSLRKTRCSLAFRDSGQSQAPWNFGSLSKSVLSAGGVCVADAGVRRVARTHTHTRLVTHFTSRTSRHATWCHVTSCHVTSRHVTSRHVISQHVTSRHVTSRHVTSRHATLVSPYVRASHVGGCLGITIFHLHAKTGGLLLSF